SQPNREQTGEWPDDAVRSVHGNTSEFNVFLTKAIEATVARRRGPRLPIVGRSMLRLTRVVRQRGRYACQRCQTLNRTDGALEDGERGCQTACRPCQFICANNSKLSGLSTRENQMAVLVGVLIGVGVSVGVLIGRAHV